MEALPDAGANGNRPWYPPAEQILLPAWFPLNVYDFACWARQTVVALSVVLALRPVRPLPFSISELDGPWHAVDGESLRALAIPPRRWFWRSIRRPLRRYCRLTPVLPLTPCSCRSWLAAPSPGLAP